MVLTVPNPLLPLYLWKDENNETLINAYLTKYPGFWCQHDVCYVNRKPMECCLKEEVHDMERYRTIFALDKEMEW
ncbi:acetoacetyl-CoA synthetase [Trichonephila clavipes]|nr:acetoacetyl-CoA synthetase [Trichonephila clavipes]